MSYVLRNLCVDSHVWTPARGKRGGTNQLCVTRRIGQGSRTEARTHCVSWLARMPGAVIDEGVRILD